MIETYLDRCGMDWILCHNTHDARLPVPYIQSCASSFFQTVFVAVSFTPAADSHGSRNCLILDLLGRNRTGQLSHCLNTLSFMQTNLKCKGRS